MAVGVYRGAGLSRGDRLTAFATAHVWSHTGDSSPRLNLLRQRHTLGFLHAFGVVTKKPAAAVTLAAALALAGAAHAQTPTPDPAPVPTPAPAPAPASPPPPATVAPPATAAAPTQPAEPARKKERPRARARKRARADEAAARPAAPADPPRTALLGAATGTGTSSASAPRPAAMAHIPRSLAEPERRWPAQAALLFVFAIGLLGLLLALAPTRLLASVSEGLPRHRQDVGIALALVMALGAGFFVLLAAA